MEQLEIIAKAKMMDAKRASFTSDRRGPHDSGYLGERLEMENMKQPETVTKGEMMNTSSRAPYTSDSDSGPSRMEEAPADRRSSNSPHDVKRHDPLNPGNPGILKKGSRFTFKKI